ncbi:enoyl-CoA hydratase/isomerase family protein [Corynebacterium guangdongense]|uniref:3-hydroxyisobutyryl-CoA hydrolase n=1 Tax=Corynebacterium guangdongense TaxID=1783348 RepID=A0ABU1ZTY1_9CORY|nr:enoyl-CoA hydratase/isomerase family protein [Corynebacterium guangdongense]MDR7328391.1 enoyl-CoA hydratase [Corynebacterium guangdongense]WJZ16968.1 putative enoyl-CoA hydratase echA8 [Corynebacterium guangdongense]
MTAHTEELIVEIRGRAGVITLNRPRALNSLNTGMIEGMIDALETWREDDAVALVIVQGAGDRAFCAGGDVASVYRLNQADRQGESDHFFEVEYTLNQMIHDYPKPYVALMDGIVLGGGLGVSAHGSHCIVTETSRIGMPETGIGLFPDVGISWILARAPQKLGMHLALTGVHVGAPEAIEVGLADTFVESGRLVELVGKLCEDGDTGHIENFSSEPPAPTDSDRQLMEQAYSGETVEEILAALQGIDAEWAEKAVTAMERACPTSLKVAHEAQRRAAAMDLAGVLAQDRVLARNMHRRHDFMEGVRAQLIDKDRNPSWNPASLSGVHDEDVARLFV